MRVVEFSFYVSFLLLL